MNNTVGPKGELSLSFKKKLEEEIGLPVFLQDERLTTKQAQDILISMILHVKKEKSNR